MRSSTRPRRAAAADGAPPVRALRSLAGNRRWLERLSRRHRRLGALRRRAAARTALARPGGVGGRHRGARGRRRPAAAAGAHRRRRSRRRASAARALARRASRAGHAASSTRSPLWIARARSSPPRSSDRAPAGGRARHGGGRALCRRRRRDEGRRRRVAGSSFRARRPRVPRDRVRLHAARVPAGRRLATAGLAVLWTNALPIVAGTVLFDESLPGGWQGAARVGRSPSCSWAPSRSAAAARI